MTNVETEKLSFSEYYKNINPDLFSDSEEYYEVELPKDQLDFILSKLSADQKQDQFEGFCRRLAEIHIAPNLIPAVGPTGGGDGKVDSDTYPVSPEISNRWFISNCKWNNKEKWAFAFSCKQEWKGKATSDIEKIISTKRGYTHIYFFTNQTPSNKKKKDFEDDQKKKHDIGVTVIDRKWMLEKVYNNDHIELAVNTLGLDDVYKRKNTIQGRHDSARIDRLLELESFIKDPNRYFENDPQLAEDAIEAAILSRELEKPKDEVVGKFERAFRLSQGLKGNQKRIKIYYQQAWTYINYFDDIENFFISYKKFKQHINEESSIEDIEKYITLTIVLFTIDFLDKYDFKKSEFSVDKEKTFLINMLESVANKRIGSSESLRAKLNKLMLQVKFCDLSTTSQELCFEEIRTNLEVSTKFLHFPFEKFKMLLEVLSSAFPNSENCDRLIDTLAQITEKRSSEIYAGRIFYNRGIQKLNHELYLESIKYFGKSIYKLAKEESKNYYAIALFSMGIAYRNIGLIWASNSSFIAVSNILVQHLRNQKPSSFRLLYAVREIATNELLIGRIYSFINWYEILRLLTINNQTEESLDNSDLTLLDGCLAVRILHTENNLESIEKMPDLLSATSLYISKAAVLYTLGYEEDILSEFPDIFTDNEQNLFKYFEKIYNEPFKEQMIFRTIFLNEDITAISSKALGCEIKLKYVPHLQLITFSETLLALIEGFLATLIDKLIPLHKTINIKLSLDINQTIFSFNSAKGDFDYVLTTKGYSASPDETKEFMNNFIDFIAEFVTSNFNSKDMPNLIKNLFVEDEISERLSGFPNHPLCMNNIFGSDYKPRFCDWCPNDEKINLYPFLRNSEIKFSNLINKENEIVPKYNFRHDDREVFELFDHKLWETDNWDALGFFKGKDHSGIFFRFKNIHLGLKIFSELRNHFSGHDKQDIIRISIIQGINKYKPYSYRVHFGINTNSISNFQKSRIYTRSYFLTIFADSPDTINNIKDISSSCQHFYLLPASFENNSPKLYDEFSILKQKLSIREAWEIGVNDLDSVAVYPDDDPIIPGHIDNAPVVELLKTKQANQDD